MHALKKKSSNNEEAFKIESGSPPSNNFPASPTIKFCSSETLLTI